MRAWQDDPKLSSEVGMMKQVSRLLSTAIRDKNVTLSDKDGFLGDVTITDDDE